MASPSPCASCKFRRRRCTTACIFAPYFPSNYPQKYAAVHKVFGASHVSKLLQELPVDQRADAVSSLVYEANARMEDPVYGCAGVISRLRSRVSELEAARGLYDMSQAQIPCNQNHEDVQGGKGEEAFETASGVVAGEAAESSDAAVKRMGLTFDLNELPSDED